MRTFDVKFKRKVVRDYLSGKGGYKTLAAKYDIANSLIRSWVRAYQHHGSAGLVRQRGQYTCDFKLEVLHRLTAENLSGRGPAHTQALCEAHREHFRNQPVPAGAGQALAG